MKIQRASWVLGPLLCLAAASVAMAGVGTATVATGLTSPVGITNAGDGSGRLFLTLQDGHIVIYDGSTVLSTAFLDIHTLVLFSGEQGLLSAAFHPNYPATPYFFVYYTRAGDGAIVIARYSVSANPNLANAASGVILKVIPHPGQSNHNGGQLQFGADGYLYFGTGDGGSGDDPPCNAQNDSSLLGKMLRVDVNQNVNTPPYYGIPPTNPFIGGGDPPDEVWAKGLRNPWRFSFDRTTGDLLIGDVGQGAREEVDFHPAASAGGNNYGWKMVEGFLCRNQTTNCAVTPPACDSPVYTPPVLDYTHAVNGRCSITGGFRYRGTGNPSLAGKYVYGDYCSGEIFLATPSGSPWATSVALDTAVNISSFGEDEAGELYMVGNGQLLKLVETTPTADLSITKTDGQGTAPAGSQVTYTITVANAGPSPADGATVTDTFPAALGGVSWTCAATGGASCGAASGTGNINRQVNVPVGGSVVFTATGTLGTAASGSLSNTANVAAPTGVPDPAAGNNSATDVDPITPGTDLAITKTDGLTTVTPGQAVTYSILATNLGPTAVTGATVTDTVPASLLSAAWTCVGAGGGTCTANGTGNINDTVNLPVSGSVTYTLTGTVDASPDSLRNTATVTPPGGVFEQVPANNSATDADTLVCSGETILVPDGRETAFTLGTGAARWFGAALRLRSSYSLALENAGGNAAPGTLTVFRGDDGCTGTSTLVSVDTVGTAPRGGPGLVRRSFTASGTEPFYRARVTNSSGSSLTLRLSVAETSLYSAAWSTNGTYDTYYSLANTTGATIHAQLVLTDTTGVVRTTANVTILPGTTTAVNTSALGTARAHMGAASLSHDGPPGAVLAEAAIANFGLAKPYVQPVHFTTVREKR